MSCQTRAVHRLHSKRPVCGQQEAFEIRNDQREKAEILCEASNVALGDLLAIDYNWGELNVVSRTEYMLDEKCLAMPMGAMADMDIEPDDIDVSDTATFVWEIR